MKNDFFSRIELYINHQMETDEVAAFESELQCNPELAGAYNLHMEMLRSLKDKDEIELRKKLKSIIGRTDQLGLEESGLSYYLKWFWMAAGIIILLSISSVVSVYFFNNENPVFYLERWLDNNWQKRDIYQLPLICNELLKENKHKEDFVMTFPEDSTVFFKDNYIAFRWINTLGSSIFLEIFDRFGNLKYASKNPAHSPEILQLDLVRGVYIYRFKTKNEILCYRMFYIR